MSNDNSQVHDTIDRANAEEPQQPSYRQKNMAKARATRLKRVQQKKLHKPVEYNIKEDSEGESDSDDEVDDDELQAIVDVRNKKKGKASKQEPTASAEQVLERVGQLEEVMRQLAHEVKKDRIKRKAQPKPQSNTKVIVLPPNPAAAEQPQASKLKSNTEMIMEYIKGMK